MTDENSNEVTRTPTREPLPQSDAPRTVTGYHVETDLDGTTHITLELRKGGTLSLHDLDPLQALLYLVALQRFLGLRAPGGDVPVLGAAYLFVRGMRPDTPGSGTVWWTPAPAAVRSVDRLLREGGR